MTRKDTIFEYVKQNASIESEGYTTTEISEALGIIRNNVSKELNVLVREGKLQKIDGRPVRYLLAEREMQSRLNQAMTIMKKIFRKMFLKISSVRMTV